MMMDLRSKVYLLMFLALLVFLIQGKFLSTTVIVPITDFDDAIGPTVLKRNSPQHNTTSDHGVDTKNDTNAPTRTMTTPTIPPIASNGGNSSSATNILDQITKINNNNNNKTTDYGGERQPKVMLHIGPHKTGTTAIQVFIRRNENTIELLRQDNVEIPTLDDLPGYNTGFPDFNFGGCMIKKFQSGGGSMTRPACMTLRPIFKKYLDTTHSMGKDILLVCEDLDRQEVDLNRIKEWLKPYTDIQIIVTYRRLHDWFKSWYNEIMRLYQKKMFQAKVFRSFVNWLQLEGQYDNFLQKHAIALETKYRNHGFPVHVMHFHRQNVSLLENLFCETYNVTNTCQDIRRRRRQHNDTFGDDGTSVSTGTRSRKRMTTRVTKDDEFELCRLVWLAKDFKGLGGRMRKCQNVYSEYAPLLAERNSSIRGDFPIMRFPQSLIDRVWNETVLAERKYFSSLGYNGEKGGQKEDTATIPPPSFWEELRQEFDHAVETKWYAVDIEEINRTKIFDTIMSRKPTIFNITTNR